MGYYYNKLFDLLCKDKESYKIFIEIFYKPGKLAASLRDYRTAIIKYRTEQCKQDFYNKVQKEIHTENWDNLYTTLRELFLEPFDSWYIKYLEKLTTEKIIDCYENNKNIKSLLIGG